MALKQPPKPNLSAAGEQALACYESYLRDEVDLSLATIRGYLGDVRLFMAWCERTWAEGQAHEPTFNPERVATPTITCYRDYLKKELDRKPATVNRYLISLKRYFAWAREAKNLDGDPAQRVKLVAETPRLLRHLTDQEEEALVAAVEVGGNLRDQTLIILMLHTGLRVSEVCQLKQTHVSVSQRSGQLQIWGKGHKYREVPLNATARRALRDYLPTLPQEIEYLFLSQRTGDRLTPRAIGFIIEKYTKRANISDLRPHDLRHRFGYRMAETVSLHRLAQIMGHDSLDTTRLYIQGPPNDLQKAVEQIAWE